MFQCSQPHASRPWASFLGRPSLPGIRSQALPLTFFADRRLLKVSGSPVCAFEQRTMQAAKRLVLACAAGWLTAEHGLNINNVVRSHLPLEHTKPLFSFLSVRLSSGAGGRARR